MSLKVQSREIGGVVYEVQQHPARRALRLVARLGKLAGALGGVLEGALSGKASRKVGDLDVGVLLQGVSRVFDVLSPDEQDAFLAELLACTAIVEPNGQKVPLWPVIDLRLQGRPLDVYLIAYFALEVNFGDFFAGLVAKAGPGATAPDASLTTS